MPGTNGTAVLETTGLRLRLRNLGVPLLFAALLALSGQVSIPIGPVPMTLQVIIVLIGAAVMSPRAAAGSMALFAAAGAAGAPIFYGGGAGPLHLMGPTGGYILGFIAGAWVCSTLVGGRRDSLLRLALAMAAGVVTIHLFGAAQLAIYLGDLKLALRQAVAFLPMDVVKIAIAASFVAGGATLFDKETGPSPSLKSE